MFDKEVLNFFLENQNRLFDEDVAQTPDEAEEFLEEVMAQVVIDSEKITSNMILVLEADSLNKLFSRLGVER